MKALIRKFFAEESGATMVEYAIMVALIAIVALLAVQVLGSKVNTTFDDVQNCLETPTAAGCGGATPPT